MQALHIPRYVAARTAEPQLLGVMSSGMVASAISCAMGMYRLLMVVTWFSVNITLPRSHRIYVSRLLAIYGSVMGCVNCDISKLSNQSHFGP